MKGVSLLVHLVWVQCHAVVTGGESRPDCDWGKSLLQHLCLQCQSVDVERQKACLTPALVSYSQLSIQHVLLAFKGYAVEP